MVQLTRKVAELIRDSGDYELLPSSEIRNEDVHMVVLFRAKDENVNSALVERINASRDVYVSGTSWKGEKATRVAVSSWRVDVERDFAVVKEVLSQAAKN